MSIASPCIDVCRMSPDTGLCEGCFRSLDEIARWSRTTEEGKLAILVAVADRRALAGVRAAAAAAGEVRS